MSEQSSPTFWLGNAILGLALILLLNMGSAWESMGIGAMVLWIILAGTGAYLVMYKPKGS